MFISPDGSITGSVHWARLEELVTRRQDESVTDEGWANLEALLAEHSGALKSAADEEEARQSKAAEDSDAAAATSAELADDGADEAPVDDGSDEPTKAELQDALRERGLPTTGNKAELVQRLNEADNSEEE